MGRRKKSPVTLLFQAVSACDKPALFTTGFLSLVRSLQVTYLRVASPTKPTNSLRERNQASLGPLHKGQRG